MIEIRSAGPLMDLPDEPGVYVIVCTALGSTDCHLGEILYFGLSNSIRRRVAYALAAPGKSAPHDAQRPLVELQRAGGSASLLYCVLEPGEPTRSLEDALLAEFVRRRGQLPRWNRQGARRKPPPEASAAMAFRILDRLNVR